MLFGHEPAQVGGSTQRTVVDLGQPELRTFGRDHHVGTAGQADARSETEVVDRAHHGDGALIDGPERLVAGLVDAEDPLVAGELLHLLDVDPGTEAPPRRGSG